MGMVKDSLFEYEPLLKHFTLTMDCGLLKLQNFNLQKGQHCFVRVIKNQVTSIWWLLIFVDAGGRNISGYTLL